MNTQTQITLSPINTTRISKISLAVKAVKVRSPLFPKIASALFRHSGVPEFGYDYWARIENVQRPYRQCYGSDYIWLRGR